MLATQPLRKPFKTCQSGGNLSFQSQWKLPDRVSDEISGPRYIPTDLHNLILPGRLFTVFIYCYSYSISRLVLYIKSPQINLLSDDKRKSQDIPLESKCHIMYYTIYINHTTYIFHIIKYTCPISYKKRRKEKRKKRKREKREKSKRH